ncbi:alpha/beta hydrolase [Marinobacter sp. JSM 1782161]|uniref:alpha/beta fold hydrolase n=1 Tax=Marinobacter sp. JSM 1782161 TaxID=2685906 RepID=UPI002B1BD48A|nr:alpha/beta hydrolase [Marinobacter sp. JSM 1782161]
MPEMPSKPTMVLIHGAWAGSWGWSRVEPLLNAAGYPTLAVDLPGNGQTPGPATLENFVDVVSTAIGSAKVVLVGHSGGGVVATQVAEALVDQVYGVVFIAGMMLPSGTGFADLVKPVQQRLPHAAGIGPHLDWSEEGTVSAVPEAAALDIFLQDLPVEDASTLAARLTPQPESGRAMVPTWSAGRFGRLPRLYIEAAQDRSVILEVQREMQARVPGARRVTLDTGHFPQASAPEAVANAILEFVEALPKPT